MTAAGPVITSLASHLWLFALPGAQSHSADLQSVDPDEWVDRFGNRLFGYAFSRLRDVGEAEELVQETFLAGLRFQHQYAGKGSQLAWLRAILKRKIIDHMRKRSRGASIDHAADPSETLFDEQGHWRADVFPAVPPDMQVESRELWAVVEKCLTYLPAIHADVFVLSVMEDLNAAQVCKELDISLSNYWTRLHRARLGLAKCVSSKWNDAEYEGQK